VSAVPNPQSGPRGDACGSGPTMSQDEKRRRVDEWISTIHAIAPELAGQRIWVVWRWEETDEGRLTKPPYQPSAGLASTSQPETWSTLDAVCEAFLDSDFDGIGLVLPLGFAALDLDLCIAEGGSLTPAVEALIYEWGSFTEITPSGRGLRLIAKGTVQPATESGLPKNMAGFRGIRKLEIKGPGQYITFTAQPYGRLRPVTDCTVRFEALQRDMQEEKKARAQKGKAQNAKGERSPRAGPPLRTDPREDDERIDAALAENPEIRALWDGIPTALARYSDADGRPDDSRADQALMNFIAPRVDFDEARAIAQMWRSGLEREKWAREDYLRRTFGAAEETYAAGGTGRSPLDSLFEQ
jgi:putative DNA primase/helicase